MPVYNGEQFLAEAIEAHLAQTFTDFELIICDNASTDRSGQICRDYAAMDSRVRYFRNETNLGAAGNYRRAFEESSGCYFRWACHDDLCAPQLLERCVEILDREPLVVLAYPRTKLIDERGEILCEYEDGLHLQSENASERFAGLFDNLRLCNALYGLIRTDVLRRTALIQSFVGSDIPLLAELTLYGKFWEVPECLFYRRRHPAASSCLGDEGKLLEFYDPKRKEQIPLTQWRHYREFFRAVKNSPLGVREKVRLNYFLVRMGVRGRNALTRELYLASRQALRRYSRI